VPIQVGYESTEMSRLPWPMRGVGGAVGCCVLGLLDPCWRSGAPRRNTPRIATVVFLALLGAAATAAFASAEERVTVNASAVRLGTAASPFGWAKVFGDLDHDGQPDMAVADRVRRSKGTSDYELEIDLSGGALQSFRFTSDQPALDLELADVDADGDLDIVAMPSLSRIASVIWVNDGAGTFHEQRVDPRAAPVLPRERLTHPGISPPDSTLAVTTSPRITTQRWLIPARHAPPSVTGALAASLNGGYYQPVGRSSKPSRAPPLGPLTL